MTRLEHNVETLDLLVWISKRFTLVNSETNSVWMDVNNNKYTNKELIFMYNNYRGNFKQFVKDHKQIVKDKEQKIA